MGMNLILGAAASALVGYKLNKYWKQQHKKEKKYKYFTILSVIASFFIFFGISHLLFASFYAKWYLKSEINENPMIDIVEKYYPQNYDILMQKLDASVSKKEDKRAIIAYSYHLTNHIFMINLKHASDDAVHAYAKSIIELYHVLFQHEPKLVLKFEYSDPSFSMDLGFLTSEPNFDPIYKAVINAKINLIKTAIATPVAPPTNEVGMMLFKKIMDKLQEKYGVEAVAAAFNPKDNQVPATDKAKVIINFYQIINNSDRKMAGDVMRFIGTINDQ